MFGRVFDRRIVGRIWAFVRPYRLQILIAITAVLVFTGTQLSIPLIIRYAIDSGLNQDAGTGPLKLAMLAFAIVVAVNYLASRVQETVVGKAAEKRAVRYSHGNVWPPSAGFAVLYGQNRSRPSDVEIAG